MHIFDGLFEQRLHFSAVTYVTFVRRLKRLDDALKSLARTSRSGSDDSRLAHQVSSLGALATLVTTTVPSPSFSRTGILHVHSCETVLRISGVTLGVLLCEPEPGPGLVLAMRATRNPISLLLGLKPHTQKTKNEKKRSGSPAPAAS